MIKKHQLFTRRPFTVKTIKSRSRTNGDVYYETKI